MYVLEYTYIANVKGTGLPILELCVLVDVQTLVSLRKLPTRFPHKMSFIIGWKQRDGGGTGAASLLTKVPSCDLIFNLTLNYSVSDTIYTPGLYPILHAAS
jgi:hypothetical protein